MLLAVIMGLCMVVALGMGLFLIAKALPPGPAREWVGFVPNCVILLDRVRRDRRIPPRGRFVLSAAVAYLVSPIQLIPNVIPVIGQADDVAVVVLALRYSCRHLPRDEVSAAWPGDPRYLERLLGAPKEVREPDARPAGRDVVPVGHMLVSDDSTTDWSQR